MVPHHGTVSHVYRPQQICGKGMFLHLSVILFTGGGVCLWSRGGVCLCPPQGRHPPGQKPLLGRHPLWADTPLPSQYWDTPPYPVHAGIHSLLCSACWDMVNKRAVGILLECILVGHTSYGDVDLLTSTSLRNLHV